MTELQNTKEGLINAFKMLQELDIKATENNMQNLYSSMVLIKRAVLQIEEELKNAEAITEMPIE